MNLRYFVTESGKNTGFKDGMSFFDGDAIVENGYFVVKRPNSFLDKFIAFQLNAGSMLAKETIEEVVPVVEVVKVEEAEIVEEVDINLKKKQEEQEIKESFNF